ncbi:unnamed protein product [Closterium sp. NIES-53]
MVRRRGGSPRPSCPPLTARAPSGGGRPRHLSGRRRAPQRGLRREGGGGQRCRGGGETPRAAAGDSTAPAGGGDPRAPLAAPSAAAGAPFLPAASAAAPAAAPAAPPTATAPGSPPRSVAASCSCRSLAHPTVLWHHRMGHPSLPRLRAMSTQRLVLGLPRVLPSLPPSPAPPCRPCVEGRLRATPHSSSLRPATEPFETLHLDAPREWHDTLRSTLSDLGFQPSSADPSLFVRCGSTPFFVLVYVDDLVFATSDRVALADVKSELQKRHTCTDLGELRHYLGLQITRDRAARTITLSQSHMVQQVLQRFGLQHSTVHRTPLAVDHRLTGPFSDEPFEPSGPYVELVGCLMYLMTCTRPDLAFPLSILARFVAPGRHRPVHWTAAVRVAKYLATTSGVGLVLGGQQSVVLTGHCDSSYADDAETHRSTQGYCFSLGSGAISWRSTRSSSVSTSTAEAEIYAGAMAAQELRWLTFLLADLGERPSSAPTLFTDNKASILLCREPRLESRVKHIHVRYFLLRELQRRGQARFEFVESEANTADIFTKALPPCDHQRCCVQLGLVDTGSSHT